MAVRNVRNAMAIMGGGRNLFPPTGSHRCHRPHGALHDNEIAEFSIVKAI
jgi:hypothetical protein